MCYILFTIRINISFINQYQFSNYQITPGNKYRLSLDIKSLKDHGTNTSGNPVDNVNSGTEPTVFIGINSGSNGVYASAGLFAHNFQISTTMETYTFDFIATKNIAKLYDKFELKAISTKYKQPLNGKSASPPANNERK